MANATLRPIAPLNHSDPAEHRRLIAIRSNASLPKDGTEGMSAPLRLASYTAANLPDASEWEGAVIYVSDGSSGQNFRGSNGTSWVNLG